MQSDKEQNIPQEFICPITLEIMKEPMVFPDGQSYEKEAIKKALEITHESPLTKIPMKFEDGVVNYSLKSLIEDFVAKNKIDLKNQKVKALPKTQVYKVEFEQLSAHIVPKGVNPYCDSIHICMKPKKVEASPPVFLIAVVDISGSMQSNCCENIASMENVYISRFELVKHSLKTIISTLRNVDIFSMITFSNNAKMVNPPTLLRDKKIKQNIIDKLNKIEPNGMTNMWSGINLAIKTTQEIQTEGYQKSIMLFTDGLSNSDPPQGIIPTLKETLSTCKNDFTISTFSFGNNVDSTLLSSIAKQGNGIYGFCPDATMVGTIFINYMANLLSTITSIVKVCVEQNGEKKKTKTIGSLYRGAYRNTMFKININEVKSTKVTVELPFTEQSFEVPIIQEEVDLNSFSDKMAQKENENKENKDDDEVLDEEEANEEIKPQDVDSINTSQPIPEIDEPSLPYEEILLNQIYRERLISLLNKVIDVQLSNLDEGVKNILEFNQSLKSLKYKTQFIKDLSLDIIDDDPNHGQIEKALRKEFYENWGNRYLTSFFRFHLFEQCGNFKDASLQSYGRHVFSVYRKMANNLFVNLPPPKAIKEDYRNYFNNSSYNNVHTNINMNAFIDQHGGCFNGEAIVLLAKGKKKSVKNLTKGDILNNGAIVDCLIEETSHQSSTNPLMSNINGVLFTPYHPVLVNGIWSFPIDIKKPEPVSIESWYNLVLKDQKGKHEVEFENGIKAITLGHYRSENKILEHPYFGTNAVVNDLKERDPRGYQNGYIFIEDNNSKIHLDENNFCVNYYKIN